MTDLEFDLLDELYFVTPFTGLAKAIGQSEHATKDTMRSLLNQEFVSQMAFDDAANDFVRQEPPDLDHPEKYHYLASKKGLLAHNL